MYELILEKHFSNIFKSTKQNFYKIFVLIICDKNLNVFYCNYLRGFFLFRSLVNIFCFIIHIL